MKIKTADLLAAIKSLSRIMKTSTTLPILGYVHLENLDGSLLLTVDNLDERAVESVEIGSAIFDSLCVNFKHLVASVGKSEFTTLDVEKGCLCIQPAGVRLNCLDGSDFPDNTVGVGTAIGVNCTDLADGIESVDLAGCDVSGRPELAAVRIVGAAKNLSCSATDGRKAALFDRPLICAAFEASIPPDFCVSLATALRRDGAVFHLSQNRATVIHANGSYSCKLSEIKLSDVSATMARFKLDDIGEIETAELSGVLRVALAVFDNEQLAPAASLIFGRDGLSVHSKSKTSSFENRVAGQFEQAEIRIDMSHLLKCLSAVRSPKMKLKLAKNSFVVIQDGDLQMCLSLLRDAPPK
jgi:DNA polymerase III sliding clamp (beta) subunit (PCNA family)